MTPELPPSLLDDLEPFTAGITSIAAISGGITNRNYKLETDNGSFMLRIAGDRTELLGIDRANEFSSATLAHQVGIGSEPIAFLERHAAILSRFIANAITLEADSATARLEQIVPRLRAFHDASVRLPATFNPFHTVRTYHALALEHGVRFPNDLPQILEQMTQIETALRPHARACPCHNDLLPANFLDDGRIWIIDWEYAGNGNPFFDLGNLAVNLELNEGDCQRLLGLYFGEPDITHVAQLQLMRLVSDLREAFWGFLQAGISSLEMDFVEYANKHLERFRQNASVTEFAHWINELEV